MTPSLADLLIAALSDRRAELDACPLAEGQAGVVELHVNARLGRVAITYRVAHSLAPYQGAGAT